MTTIYELEKQATPGPWIVESNFFPDEKDIEANQKMIVHCRNHFMEALEALKGVLKDTVCPFCGRDNSLYPDEGCTSDDCPGVELVKKLETVE